MNAVAFSRVAGTVFVVIALAHLYRLVSNFPIQLGSFSVPHWVSWVGVLAPGTLGWLGIRARAPWTAGKEAWMPDVFHPDEIEVLRSMPPREAFERVKNALYRGGSVSSDEFLEAYEQLVELGILTPEQLEEYLG